jgi:uncharacterized protein YprB with RNaseH-like and TPR domain
MSNLSPVAFDIETTGLAPDAQITVAGLAHELGVTMVLNTDSRPANHDELVAILDDYAHVIDFTLCEDEASLLGALAADAQRLDGDTHYLTAFNGEVWNGGFDLQFLRSRCVAHDHSWPFPDLAYADVMDVVDRFATGGVSDLEGCYETLVGGETCDPFDDSGAAVTAWENAEWGPLLLHNLADIQRTHELAKLAERYVPSSDFGMKNLAPPEY